MQDTSIRPSSAKQSCSSGTHGEGTVSKSCGSWASSLELPRGFSYKTVLYKRRGQNTLISYSCRNHKCCIFKVNICIMHYYVTLILFRILDHTMSPTAGEYNLICQRLVETYPMLADRTIGAEDDTFCPVSYKPH